MRIRADMAGLTAPLGPERSHPKKAWFVHLNTSEIKMTFASHLHKKLQLMKTKQFELFPIKIH